MTFMILKDTVQASPSNTGPRFRPYASPNHHVTKGRYITSNDPRGYIPVYEYPLNGQWIMMDIDDGYILWTGIWKVNVEPSLADIVKMIDSQPDLAPLIRRVRGGYLKIQGTWMPYEVALRLSRRVAWTIRDDLIPLFGPTFPSTCLSPDQPGYGQVVASGPNRRRARRNTQSNTSMNPPREPWTVVTPHDPAHSRHPPQPQPPYLHTAFYPPNHDVQFHHGYEHPSFPSPHNGSGSVDDPASPSSTSRSFIRYSPYNTPYTTNRPSSEGRKDLSLDIPSLSLRDNGLPTPSSRVIRMEHITLAPIHAPADSEHSTSPYALPPISAMEDLRGLYVNDSAAVLRRLKAEDPSSNEGKRHSDEWRRRPQPTVRRDSHEPFTSRPYPDHSYRSRSSSESDSDNHTSHSTCDPSPISPATPRSASSNRDHYVGPAHHPSAALTKEYERYHAFPVAKVTDWPREHHPRGQDGIPVKDVRNVGRGPLDTDNETHPHRPW
ncbi:Transcriptional repressor XBP1 [Termitomyces sp. J132]|nr:Transcriptional repressor XBP1 [Termitomyces sp. J132]